MSCSVLKFFFGCWGEGGEGLGSSVSGKEVLENTESTDCIDSWHSKTFK